MANEIRNMKVKYISLVSKGANKKRIILKSAGFDKPDFSKTIKISKEIEGVVYGIVYSPGEVDEQGDFATAAEIKKAAYNFMKNLGNQNVDKNHSFKKVDAYVAESWITKTDDSIFSDEPEGSWAVGIKLEDDTLIKAVRDGKITGLSMAGEAERIQKNNDNNDTVLKRFFESIAKIGKNTGSNDKINEELERGFEAIKKTLNNNARKLSELENKIEKYEKNLKKSGQKSDFDDDPDINGIV